MKYLGYIYTKGIIIICQKLQLNFSLCMYTYTTKLALDGLFWGHTHLRTLADPSVSPQCAAPQFLVEICTMPLTPSLLDENFLCWNQERLLLLGTSTWGPGPHQSRQPQNLQQHLPPGTPIWLGLKAGWELAPAKEVYV